MSGGWLRREEMRMYRWAGLFLTGASCALASLAAAQTAGEPRLERLKTDAIATVDSSQKLTQEIVDSLFSFSELAFQEFETQRYLTDLLKKNGFTVETGVSGMPSSWWATWGSGEPVIALGSDIDGIPKASQLPGVAYRQPMVDGAPGHGEGHNSGQAVNIVAALAVKEIMQRERIPGTIVLWPGVAEELLAAKAWFVRDGRFDGVDAVLFTHVGSRLGTAWGHIDGTGLVSVEYSFEGTAAHSAVMPWRGRSALDAVELMNIGWNFRREHLNPTQRSHYVIADGGDQPNVVPPAATVWYFIREIEAAGIRQNFGILQQIAEGAALMTDTTLTRRIVGAAWPRHFNRPMAVAMQANINSVGMPRWSVDDQVFARALQQLLEVPQTGLQTDLQPVGEPSASPVSGGSDDIGDVSWVVPTAILSYPSNVPGMTGHHWSSAMAMATPIAHQGATAGAKVIAATVLELMLDAGLRDDAARYFRDEQQKGTVYEPFIGPDDAPPIEKNTEIMAEFKERLRPLYYDPRRFDTYLEQLGIDYPQLEKPPTR
jgi:aminobenzoyl-glutamate utilization protein B